MVLDEVDVVLDVDVDVLVVVLEVGGGVPHVPKHTRTTADEKSGAAVWHPGTNINRCTDFARCYSFSR